MLKKLIAALLALFAAAAFAAVDVNKATQAELEAVKGIGPAISGKILDERKKAPFKDWQDMVERVKGVGEGNAAKFSTEGLTVNGAAFAGAPTKAAANEPTMKKTDGGLAKPAAGKPAPMTAPAATAATASGAMKPSTATAPASADDKRSAAAQTKEDKKAAKAASAAEARQAKADKAAAKKGAREDKPAAAAAAPASAAKK
jgi:competence protein ComEA